MAERVEVATNRVTEDLFNRKLKEIEHIFRVSFTRQQRLLWFARISTWDEEVFAIACEKLVNTVEQRWQVRDGNLVAMLRNLTKRETRDAIERQRQHDREKEWAEAEKAAEPMTEQLKELWRKVAAKLRVW